MIKQARLVALASLLCGGVLAQAAPVLEKVTTTKHGNGLIVTIEGSELAAPRELRVVNNTSYILEFDGNLAGRAQHNRVNHAGVTSVEVGWFQARPPKVRVHFRVRPEVQPVVEQIDGNWVVAIGDDAQSRLATKTETVAVNEDERAMQRAIDMLRTPTGPTVLQGNPSQPLEATPEALVAQVTQQGDRFPDRVPPLEPVRNGGTAAPAAGQPRATVPSSQLVSLDFVATDIIQILRALSFQAGVNIVAAPEVSPEANPVRLTLTLNRVTLDEALGLVTAMAGLRYATVGNTFVVTRSENFGPAMRQIMDRGGDEYDTRVVNLMSGEAAQIREATLKAFPPEGRGGYYDILFPGQQGPASAPPAPSAPTLLDLLTGGQSTNGEGGEAAPQARPAAAPPVPGVGSNGRAGYVMLVGDRNRLDTIERYVREIDGRIAASFSLSGTRNIGTIVVPVISGETERITGMLDRLLANNPRRDEYTITETSLRDLPEGEESTQLIMMIGPAEELETLRQFAMTLDEDLCRAVGIAYTPDAADRERFYEVVDLFYIEPAIAEFDLKSRVRGLQVTVLPDNVLPGISGTREASRQAAPQDQVQGRQEEARDDFERDLGREPMRLMLRGTREQIDRARQYLTQVDLPPRQIAAELYVLSLNQTDALRLGIDWNILREGRVQNLGVGHGATTNSNIGGAYEYAAGRVFNFAAQLEQTNLSSKIIARPNVLLSHARPNTIFVGDTVRFIESIQSSQQGVSVVTGEVETGVRFDIQASIGADGNVAMRLRSQLSFLTGFTPVPGGGQLPQTSDRVLETFVDMKAGETIALGGLIREEERRRVTGIPILKDIPIIGALFSFTERESLPTEVVFILTTREVTPGTPYVTPAPRDDAALPFRNRSETGPVIEERIDRWRKQVDRN